MLASFMRAQGALTALAPPSFKIPRAVIEASHVSLMSHAHSWTCACLSFAVESVIAYCAVRRSRSRHVVALSVVEALGCVAS